MDSAHPCTNSKLPYCLQPIGSFQMLLTEFAQMSVAVWILCVLLASLDRIQVGVVGLNCDHWITGGGWICWLGFLPCSRQSEARHNDAGRDFHTRSELLPSSEHPSASSCFLSYPSSAQLLPVPHTSPHTVARRVVTGEGGRSLTSCSVVPHG